MPSNYIVVFRKTLRLDGALGSVFPLLMTSHLFDVSFRVKVVNPASGLLGKPEMVFFFTADSLGTFLPR